MSAGGATDALIVIDMQRDFCPGGALPAPTGAAIIPAVNRHLKDAREKGVPVYASRDWHPVVTSHFQPYGGEWPPHCIQGTEGAEFHPALELPANTTVVSKGNDPERPGYSAFDGQTPDHRPLLDDLRRRRIVRLLVAGVATEYCVKHTVIDALRAGLRVSVLLDAIGGIDRQPGDANRSLQEMADAGAELVS